MKKKPFKLLDRTRSIKKGIMVEGLQDLMEKGKKKMGYSQSMVIVHSELRQKKGICVRDMPAACLEVGSGAQLGKF